MEDKDMVNEPQNLDQLLKENEALYEKLQAIQADKQNLQKKLDSQPDWQAKYNQVIQSGSWKLTEPMRRLLRVVKRMKRGASLSGNCPLIGANVPKEGNSQSMNGQRMTQLNNKDQRRIQPIQCAQLDRSVTRFNLVIDHLDIDHLDQIVTNSILIINEMAQRKQIQLRILSREEAIDSVTYKSVFSRTQTKPYEHTCFYSDFERDSQGNISYKLDVSEDDIFFATSWNTLTAAIGTALQNRVVWFTNEQQLGQLSEEQKNHISLASQKHMVGIIGIAGGDIADGTGGAKLSDLLKQSGLQEYQVISYNQKAYAVSGTEYSLKSDLSAYIKETAATMGEWINV